MSRAVRGRVKRSRARQAVHRELIVRFSFISLVMRFLRPADFSPRCLLRAAGCKTLLRARLRVLVCRSSLDQKVVCNRFNGSRCCCCTVASGRRWINPNVFRPLRFVLCGRPLIFLFSYYYYWPASAARCSMHSLSTR